MGVLVNSALLVCCHQGAFNSLAVMDSVVKNAVENERRLLLEALASITVAPQSLECILL
jgi:hypothetical protein